MAAPDGVWTIGRLARRFRLARSTLLYYDRLGLLRPSGRTRAGYRVYDDDAAARLEKVCVYRRAGVPLADIAKLLAAARGAEGAADVLAARLAALDAEIARCREQQRVIVRLLGSARALRTSRSLDKAR
jgi:DNA-binding transcriptional MerR regulator